MAELKRSVAVYPEALRERIVPAFLRHVEFGLDCAVAPAERNHAYIVVGTLARASMYLSHALLAHNRRFFINEKTILDDLTGAPLTAGPDAIAAPRHYAARIGAVLGDAGTTPVQLTDRLDRLRGLLEEAQRLIER